MAKISRPANKGASGPKFQYGVQLGFGQLQIKDYVRTAHSTLYQYQSKLDGLKIRFNSLIEKFLRTIRAIYQNRPFGWDIESENQDKPPLTTVSLAKSFSSTKIGMGDYKRAIYVNNRENIKKLLYVEKGTSPHAIPSKYGGEGRLKWYDYSTGTQRGAKGGTLHPGAYHSSKPYRSHHHPGELQLIVDQLRHEFDMELSAVFGNAKSRGKGYWKV
jgi:hypothetical protein